MNRTKKLASDQARRIHTRSGVPERVCGRRPLRSAKDRVGAMSAAAVGVLFGVQSALAGIPLVEMTIEVSDGFASTFNPVGTDNGDGSFNYVGFVSEGVDWEIDFDFNVDPNVADDGAVYIASGYTADNNT